MRSSYANKRAKLANKWNVLEFETNSRRAWINGTMVWLQRPSRYERGKGWTIPAVDYETLIDPILRSHAYVPKLPKLVVLDPGHGGKDTGAIGKRKVYEKLAVLSIAKRVKARLEARKIRVKMTRTTDVFIPLETRSLIARKAKADLFVSIHADSSGSASAAGIETFVLTAPGCESSNQYGKGGNLSARPGNAYDAANAILGFSVQSNLIKQSGHNDRGLRRARFCVLKNAPCPATLVECGFLSNPTEEALMIRADYREKLAHGIANGVLGYLALARHAGKK